MKLKLQHTTNIHPSERKPRELQQQMSEAIWLFDRSPTDDNLHIPDCPSDEQNEQEKEIKYSLHIRYRSVNLTNKMNKKKRLKTI